MTKMNQKKDYIDFNKLADGDHETFEDLFMDYFPKTKAFINHLVKDNMVAEELAQDVFTTIWVNRASLININSFNSYIYKIAKNTALQFLNRKYLEENYKLKYKPEIITASFETSLYADETRLLINMAVQRMPEQRRKVFLMSREKHLSNDEIANELNLSPKTVENHLTLALKYLKQILKLSNISIILFLLSY